MINRSNTRRGNRRLGMSVLAVAMFAAVALVAVRPAMAATSKTASQHSSTSSTTAHMQPAGKHAQAVAIPARVPVHASGAMLDANGQLRVLCVQSSDGDLPARVQLPLQSSALNIREK